MSNDYGFVVVHVPHASTVIPEEYRKTIVLDEKRFWRELRRMTDAFCDELYDAPEFPNRVVANLSRFVCDVERFRDENLEVRAKKGQGLMYTRTTYRRRLRHFDAELREKILNDIYDPHHERLTTAVDDALGRYGKCLIIDGHSFNSRMIMKPDNLLSFPDFDIGTDSYHTPAGLLETLRSKARELGYSTKVNTPFGGAITQMKHYQKDKRVVSVMFETNRRMYMDEKTMTKSASFDKTKSACRELMLRAAEYVRDMTI